MPPPADWSRLEVEATVADYLAMLAAEIAGHDFNKREHNSALRRQLASRSQGSVEFKHQNISAVLRDLGHPWIDGYKPRGNYQGLLREVVEARLAGDVTLRLAVEADVIQSARAPTVADYLDREERPPESEAGRSPELSQPPRPGVVDYLALEARNASLGRAGEEFVLDFERARLVRAGKQRLADRVEHIAATQGDGAGFDIHSYEETGRDRLIEVKTTAYSKRTPFFVTPNEGAVSSRRRSEYHLYRVFRFRRDPRLFRLRGALDQLCELRPTQFSARVG